VDDIMKQLRKTFSSMLALALLVVGFGFANPAHAQDNDEFERTEQLLAAWESAVEAYQARNFSESFRHFERVAELGATLSDPKAKETAQRAAHHLPRVAYAEGITALQAENHQAALDAFDRGWALDDSYLNNLLGRGQALQRMDRRDEAVAIYQDVLQRATAANDQQVARRAGDAIRGQYHPRASRILAAENVTRTQAQQVIDTLTEMQEHIEANEDTYYMLAVASNVVGQHDNAIRYIDQALEMHRGSRTDRARFYFEKGEAYRYKGDVAAAKEAYQNAAVGDFRARAEHFIETL
jgi:tetratricopeptide (TPR) repeat protein